jgi:hypothetical protein
VQTRAKTVVIVVVVVAVRLHHGRRHIFRR